MEPLSLAACPLAYHGRLTLLGVLPAVGLKFGGVCRQDAEARETGLSKLLLQPASWGEKGNTITVGSEINTSEF